MAAQSRRARADWYVESAELAAVQVVISDHLCDEGVARVVVEHSHDTRESATILSDPEYWHGLFVPRLRGVHLGGTPATVLDLTVLRPCLEVDSGFAATESFTMGVLDPGYCLDVAVRQDEAAANEVRAAMVEILVAQNQGAFPHLQDDLLAISPIESW